MLFYILAYVTTGFVFLAMDAVWLTAMANVVYRPLLGDMMLERFSFPPAMIFYLMYVAGMVIFVVAPAAESGRWTHALLYGALLGLLAYGTYDLTNQATLKGWPIGVTLVDMAWGTFVTAVSCTLGYLAATSLTRWFAS